MAISGPRRWWARKRWRLAAALWLSLPILYLLSLGPAAYLVGRGWADAADVDPYYAPIFFVYEHPSVNGSVVAHLLGTYVNEMNDLGKRHAAP